MRFVEPFDFTDGGTDKSKKQGLFIYNGISTIVIRWGQIRYWDQQCEGLG